MILAPIPSRPFNREYTFITARSSGPGGQHVNKTETKVVLLFNIENSQILSQYEKATLCQKLKNRINAEGFLQIMVQDNSSQIMNKKLAEERFLECITQALKKKKKRIPVKPSRAARERRILAKKKQGEKKTRRKLPD